jgi:3-hydroxyisobutyrate dehydrogenase-like beta-hydroxyacid dehydrogenase
MKVAIFGLGIIGSIWAHHYEADGLLAAAWNRSPKPELPRWCSDALTAAKQGDVLQLVVADPPAVDQVLAAITPALGPGIIVVQSSTIDPVSAERFCARVRATGAAYVEAPFTGSKPAAEARATIYFLGGEAAALELAEQILSRISAKRFRVGTPSQAAALKLSMNLQIATVAQALAEGLTFAREAGVADDVFFDVLNHNVACSGLVALKGPKLRAGDWSAQFSVKHLLKDLRLALGASTARGLPATALLTEQLQRATDAGWADEDFTALFKLIQPPMANSGRR